MNLQTNGKYSDVSMTSDTMESPISARGMSPNWLPYNIKYQRETQLKIKVFSFL